VVTSFFVLFLAILCPHTGASWQTEISPVALYIGDDHYLEKEVVQKETMWKQKEMTL
jgi:hypothetical protein